MPPVIPILKESEQLEQSPLVELWEIDLTPFGGELYRFCNQPNEKGEAVVWQGQKFEAYPVQGEGFELSGEGSSARPKLKLANLQGLITAAVQEYGQLLGVRVTRRMTFAKFLDAENFEAGNRDADPTQEVVSVFLIERVVALTAEVVTLELSTPAEADGSVVPSRIMLTNVCCWKYRGEGCGYTGKPVADADDNRTNDPEKDECSRRVSGCQARFGATAVLPIGAWLSADKVN